MSILELMKRRCSVRKFDGRSVEESKLRAVLEAGRVAPSACNKQPWRFVVVTEAGLRRRISDKWGELAQAIIVAVGDHREAWRRRDGKDHCDIDVAIAVDHMTLAAVELGLGTCWVCAFDTAACAAALELPAGFEPIALLPIGYPAEQSDPERHSAMRKPMESIVGWNRFVSG